ncbi:hypothetical protein C5S35_01225 [Candidatus Methanophagaceae archaeon]|nr:hypothetical protein C5S35_01225 [Methanophagales archaeon]
MRIHGITRVFTIVLLTLIIPAASFEITHDVNIIDYDEEAIFVYVTTSQVAEITLERFEPVRIGLDDVRYGKANYKVMGINCVVGRHATFKLQPIDRTKDIVIPVTLRYENKSRTLTYTVIAPEPSPTPLMLAPVISEPVPVPEPEQNNNLMLVLGAIAVLAFGIIVYSTISSKRA